jgi:hypothetical protein
MTFDIKFGECVLSIPVLNDTFAPVEIVMEQVTHDAEGKLTGTSRLKGSITPHPDWIFDNRSGNSLYTCHVGAIADATEKMRQHREEIEKCLAEAKRLETVANDKSTAEEPEKRNP